MRSFSRPESDRFVRNWVAPEKLGAPEVLLAPPRLGSARGNSRADRFGFGLRFLACASLQLEVVDA